MPLPLQGIRVVEFGDFLPSAFTCMQLGDFGAEVIRVQAPARAAAGRRAEQAAAVPAEKRSPFQAETAYDTTGRNRRSVVLDLKSEAGREAGRRLAGHCDVLVEGFRPGVMARLGLDYATLSASHPRLVYCSVSLFGQDGPYRDWPGHDPMGLAVAGLFHLASDPRDDVPRMIGAPIGDVGAGLHATIGILLALRERDLSGRGQQVDISMTDASLAYGILASVQVLQGTTVPRLNRPNPVSGLWETADGKYLCTTNIEPHHWANFCRSIGRPDLVPLRFDRARRDELTQVVADVLRTRTRDEWLAVFHGAEESQAAPVNRIEEVFDDPQLRARGLVIESQGPDGTRGRQLGFPVRLGRTPGSLRSVTPAPGADTRAVLADLGYAEADIDVLIASGSAA